jgi:hydrogenase expression/formation protein HypD
MVKSTIDEIKKNIDFLSLKLKGLHKDRIYNIMEVCGTHTMSIARFGISQLLGSNINLISGPGCPVCVTSAIDIDNILKITGEYDVTLFTFGDMMKVPGTETSLAVQKSLGRKIRICYSPLDALEFAVNNPGQKVVFLAIGFETTAPLTAVVVKKASDMGIKNFHIFTVHKIIPPAIEALLTDRDVNIDALLLPGHVSAIIGLKPYMFISEKYGVPAAIGGFEAESILRSLYLIMKQLVSGKYSVEIEYKSAVKENGNTVAQKLINEVFDIRDSAWRGIGIIKDSGLLLREGFDAFDARKVFPVNHKTAAEEPPGCECGNILKGIKKPYQCRLFKKRCTPDNPVGPCMVSSEGACAAYFKYYK